MEPIVHGLENSNPESADFRRIDANGEEGRAVYRAYGLRGHPAFVILNPSGEVVWIGIGELTPDELQNQIDEAQGE